jgi:hypothetical protein
VKSALYIAAEAYLFSEIATDVAPLSFSFFSLCS